MKLRTSKQISTDLAARVKRCRIHRGFTQETLSEISGVPLSTYKRFEQKGLISLEGLIRVAIALEIEHGFDELFALKQHIFNTLDEVENAINLSSNKKPRMRVRH